MDFNLVHSHLHNDADQSLVCGECAVGYGFKFCDSGGGVNCKVGVLIVTLILRSKIKQAPPAFNLSP